MKILICSSIYPPDVGSEALEAKKLFESFTKTVNWTYVATYRWERVFPPIVRNAVFFLRIIPRMIWADAVFALDFLYCGFPTVFFGKILKKKHVVIIKHDSLWESYIERTSSKVLLSDFYKKIKSGEITLSKKEKIKMHFIKKTLAGAKGLVFSSKWLLDIEKEAYGFDDRKCMVSKVPFSKQPFNSIFGSQSDVVDRGSDSDSDERVIVGGSRALTHKQVDDLKEVFADLDIDTTAQGIKLDTVRVIYDSFLEKLDKAYALVTFSLGDSVSMSAVHALERGKPVVMTKHTGMHEFFGDSVLYADTLDKESMKEAIRHILDADLYKKQVERIRALKMNYSWDEYSIDLISFLVKQNKA